MNKPAHRGEILEGPNDQGEYLVLVYWMSDYFIGHPDGEDGWKERAQVFLTEHPGKRWETIPPDKWKDSRKFILPLKNFS